MKQNYVNKDLFYINFYISYISVNLNKRKKVFLDHWRYIIVGKLMQKYTNKDTGLLIVKIPPHCVLLTNNDIITLNG